MAYHFMIDVTNVNGYWQDNQALRTYYLNLRTYSCNYYLIDPSLLNLKMRHVVTTLRLLTFVQVV